VSLSLSERCPTGNQRRERREGQAVTKVVTIENLLGDHLTVNIEKHGGADRDRTDDLLNAIIPNLSRASYSWKKYPAFLTADDYQIFLALEVLS
jgi:hypothetical protein